MEIEELIEKSFWKDILYEIISTMDPWDIDICRLATLYSDRVEKMRDINFRIPANVILVSSVLLRMKADIVASIEINPLEFAPDIDEGIMFGELDIGSYTSIGELGEYSDLEKDNGDELPFKVKPKRVTKRRVTAEELIAAIQKVLEDREIKSRLKREDKMRLPIEITLTKDIRQLIEETYKKLVSILSEKKNEIVLFSEMVPERKEILPTFMSLLHLSNDQKISLRQERIYDEIFISVR
ncbi:MAG: segregation/condensation protein A [Candidatus Altiarchaeota archaeon]|nr:segregation/condensation protein A [Candidatus Altiarchaeota archaeon]